MNIRQSSETVVVILKDSHASFLFEINIQNAVWKGLPDGTFDRVQ